MATTPQVTWDDEDKQKQQPAASTPQVQWDEPTAAPKSAPAGPEGFGGRLWRGLTTPLPRPPGGGEEEQIRVGSGPAVTGLTALGTAGVPVAAIASRSLAPFAPLVTGGLGAAGGALLGRGAGAIAGLPEKGQEIAGDIGGLAGGTLGAMGGSKLVRPGLNELARIVRDPMTGKVRTPWEIGVDKLLPDPNAPKALPARPIPKGTNYGQFLQDKAATTQAETEARQPVPIAEGPTAPQHEAVRSAQTAVARQNARQFVPVSESPVPAPITPEGAKLPPLIPPGGAGRLGPGFSGTEGRPATWTNEFVLDQAAKGNREGIAQVARRGLPMPAGARYVMGDVDFPRAVYNPRETTRFTPEGTPIRDVTLPEKGSRKLIQTVGATPNPREVTQFTAEGNVAPAPPAAIPVAPLAPIAAAPAVRPMVPPGVNRAALELMRDNPGMSYVEAQKKIDALKPKK